MIARSIAPPVGAASCVLGPVPRRLTEAILVRAICPVAQA